MLFSILHLKNSEKARFADLKKYVDNKYIFKNS